MKKFLIVCISLLVISGVAFVFTTDIAQPAGVSYRNTTYGFAVALPESWEGYTVSESVWSGDAAGDQLGEVHYTQGPVVSIRNPRWTPEQQYQDIPVMIFTHTQWEELQAETFHIGAAPIGPSELGRTSTYIFALPARYNYTFPPGHEEVETILQGKPLSTFEL